MSEHNTIDPKNIVREATDPKRGILEELNLPPKVIKFIRENSKNIQIAIVCIVVVILASSSYDYYKDKQRDKSASLLANAMQQATVEQKKAALAGVVDDHYSTGAALIARIELGHLAYAASNYKEAISIYKDAIDDMSSNNPMLPLVQLNLAQAYENAQDMDNALSFYQLVAKTAGFEVEGHMAIGRIHESKGQIEEAKKAFQQAIGQEGINSNTKIWLEEKLVKLESK